MGRGDAIVDRAREIAPDLVRWRRDLHRHPELGFEETRTAAFVAERLESLGVDELRTGVARTGVVGILRSPRADRPAVLLRADMDALPVHEVEGREYGSSVPGKMHACGHDGHTAMLLGAATLLAERRAELPGDVVLCFQPGEEGMGGAREMIAEGVLDWTGARRAFGVHLWTPFRAGTLHVRPGPIMAAQDEFDATVLGRGGHGALPHEARDPVLAAALGVTAIQNVVARFVDPVRPAVATVGSLHAGSAPNVIPDEARLRGTLRSFDEETREILRRRVEAALDGAARACDCGLRFDLRPGYPAVVNDAGCVETVRRAGAKVFSRDGVRECPPVAAAEDFAYFLQALPGAFAFVGAGNPDRGITAPHHAPGFDIDESVLPLGAEFLARIALDKGD